MLVADEDDTPPAAGKSSLLGRYLLGGSPLDTLLRALFFGALAVLALVSGRFASAVVALAVASVFGALWTAQRRRT